MVNIDLFSSFRTALGVAAVLVVNIDEFSFLAEDSSFLTAAMMLNIDVLSFLAMRLVPNNDGFSGVTSLYTRRLNRLSSLFANGKVMIGVSKSFWLPV